MRHRDGSIRWFLARGSVVRKNGKGARMTGTDTHITDRKHAEQALDFAQTELTRVSRLTSLGEFAASVAHEVRQPLTSIVLNAEACLRWLNGASPDLDKIREALDDVMAASNRADEVIQRNRELFRMHSVSKELLDMNAVIRAVALLAGPRLHKSHMMLATSLTTDLPAVMGDRIELEQVLLNLIANSIDATEQLPPGKRKVAIRSALTADGSVQVSVSDNGVGLDEVDRDQLFTLSYTTKASGTGVGLSLCRSIIEAHGGRLFVAPTPGPGATFCFTIPVAAREAAPAVPPLVHA
jgi:signal transduction histidine kinase